MRFTFNVYHDGEVTTFDKHVQANNFMKRLSDPTKRLQIEVIDFDLPPTKIDEDIVV